MDDIKNANQNKGAQSLVNGETIESLAVSVQNDQNTESENANMVGDSDFNFHQDVDEALRQPSNDNIQDDEQPWELQSLKGPVKSGKI